MAQSLACTAAVIRAKWDNVHLSGLLIRKVNLIEAKWTSTSYQKSMSKQVSLYHEQLRVDRLNLQLKVDQRNAKFIVDEK